MVLQQEVLARLLAASPRGFAHNNGGNSSQMVSVARLDLRSVDGLVPRCAWQMFATATTFPLAFPDVGSVYQVKRAGRPSIETGTDQGHRPSTGHDLDLFGRVWSDTSC